MTDILLDYAMRVTKTIPLASPSLQYLQNVLVVVKPKGEAASEIVRIGSKTDLEAITEATAPLSLLSGGKSYFYALPVSDLDLTSATITNPNKYEFFTILIDPAFTDEEVGGLKLPTDFKGVVGGASTDDAFTGNQNKKANYAWFFEADTTDGNNMYKAFGSLLTKPKNRWSNQQYLKLDYDDGTTLLSTADALFDLRANFALTGSQYGTRLALFCVGSESGEVNAIVAPYLYEEVTVRLQGAALTWIQTNEPDYTIANAALLEQHLQKLLDEYVENGSIPSATISVSVGNEQFIMNGSIAIGKPSALWRIKANMIEGA